MNNYMLYNDQQYHILDRPVGTNPIKHKILCARDNLVPLGIYLNWEEDELPAPAWVCIDCKCMNTMRELAE